MDYANSISKRRSTIDVSKVNPAATQHAAREYLAAHKKQG